MYNYVGKRELCHSNNKSNESESPSPKHPPVVSAKKKSTFAKKLTNNPRTCYFYLPGKIGSENEPSHNIMKKG